MTWTTHLPLIAILRGITPDEVEAHAEVLLAEGFEAIEVPLNSPAYLQSIRLLIKNYGEKAMIGAGTVVSEHQVAELHNIGCRFIVTPNTDRVVVAAARRAEMVCTIGCATPSEAFNAIHAGASALKVFPASCFGPAYIGALKTVLPTDIPVFAVGGVTTDNLADYLAVGCLGAGLGNDLYKAGQTPEETQCRAKKFVDAYKACTA